MNKEQIIDANRKLMIEELKNKEPNYSVIKHLQKTNVALKKALEKEKEEQEQGGEIPDITGKIKEQLGI